MASWLKKQASEEKAHASAFQARLELMASLSNPTIFSTVSAKVIRGKFIAYKPKFYCRRQSGMNFGYVTENGVNSNVASPLCQNLRQKSAVFKIS